MILSYNGQTLYQGDWLACYNGGTISAALGGDTLNVYAPNVLVELTGFNTPDTTIFDDVALWEQEFGEYASFFLSVIGDDLQTFIDDIGTYINSIDWGGIFVDMENYPWLYDRYIEEFYDGGGGDEGVGGGGGGGGGCQGGSCHHILPLQP